MLNCFTFRRVHCVMAAGIAISSLAPAAIGQQDAWLDLQCSYAPDEDGSWSDSLVYGPSGTQIYIRVVMHIPQTYHGAGLAVFNIQSDPGQWVAGQDQYDLSTAKGDPDDARMPGFDYIPSDQAVYNENGKFRVDIKGDAANDHASGIATYQAQPWFIGTLFNTGKSVTIYKFAITPSTIYSTGMLKLRIADGANHGSPDEIQYFSAYETASSGTHTIIPGAYGDTATIFIPAPAGSLLATTIIGFSIRRRRT